MPFNRSGNVIGELYEAALGQRRWDDVARRMRESVGGQSLILMTHQPLFEVTEILTTQNLPPEALKAYAEHYAPQDVWIRGMEEKRLTDRVVRGGELIDDRAFERTEFYWDFLKPRVPMFHITCGLLTLGGGRRAVLGIHRPREAGAFDESEASSMEILLRHLRSALFLRNRLGDAHALAESAFAALDRLIVGVVMVDGEGKVMHANPAAENILKANDGLAIRNRTLRAAGAVDDMRVQALINGTCRTAVGLEPAAGAGGRARIGRPSGRTALAIAVTPAGGSLSLGGKRLVGALVFIKDPEASVHFDAKSLESQLGLTPVTSRLVQALASGQSLAAYANAANLPENTVRKQLARAFDQTRTNSQLELMRLVYTTDFGIREIR